MSSAANVAALGAVDRYNYGDLVFPLVLREALALAGLSEEVVAYGLVERDLSRSGAMPNRSYRRLVEDARRGSLKAIVVVGGEVVGAEWTTMLSHLGSSGQATAIRAARKLLGRDASNRLVARVMGAPTAWPWVFTRSELGVELPIIYNSVGGASSWPSLTDRQRSHLAAALRDASYLSARDPDTRSHLARAGVEGVILAPDSAVVMADLWPLAALADKVRPQLSEAIDARPFMVVQTNTRVGSSIASRLAEEVSAFAEGEDLAVVPLPIGRAAGHDDAIALRPFDTARSTLLPPADVTIWEIMYLIARSRLFLGTSLHGSITALSYATPHLALTEQVPKLTAHLAAWSVPALHAPALIGDLGVRCAQALAVPTAALAARSDEVRRLAWVNLESIAAVITAGRG